MTGRTIQRIARVLESLDAGLLREHGCWLGGGTAISLRLGEFRESVDIDFLISDGAGYRELRQRLRGATSLAPITPNGIAPIPLTRELRMDQYGLRGFVDIGLQPIKLASVNGGRIEFTQPGAADEVCGVGTLCWNDLAASKLLADADRWRDYSVCSWDAIDLALMTSSRLSGKEKAGISPLTGGREEPISRSRASSACSAGHGR